MGRYLPNIVEIGGVHLTKSNTQLPKDLKHILDNAKHGVVYMNFGSNVRSSELSIEKRNAFLKVFKTLKQTVLWKWEDDSLENKPENVITKKWFPQDAVLAHPNIKVFISHGGLLGTQEAVFNGIPIIGVPIYGDQYNNLLQMQDLGCGKLIEYHNINEDSFNKIMKEVLNNESYFKNAKQLSKRFKDRPMSALDTAMFWIEYVIRNNGAHYLRNPALELNWIAWNMLDVYTFILLLLIFVLYGIYKLVLGLVRIILSSEESKKKKKEKKRK